MVNDLPTAQEPVLNLSTDASWGGKQEKSNTVALHSTPHCKYNNKNWSFTQKPVIT